MSTPEFTDQTFADRLYEQLLPFANLDQSLHLRLLCNAIGGMFQPQEDLVATRSDDLSGYANLLDIDECPAENLDYLGQFVGSNTRSDLTGDQQREWIRSLPGPSRGRPATTLSLLASYMVDPSRIRTVERFGSAWRYKITTRTTNCIDVTACNEIVQSQKPGPDIATFALEDYVDFGWLAGLGGSTTAPPVTFGDLAASATLTDFSALANELIT